MYPTLSLQELSKRARLWCCQEYGHRIHGTTQLQPYPTFLEIEKPALLPLPNRPFEIPLWKEAIVHPDHYIQFNKKAYSLPTDFIGKTVSVDQSVKGRLISQADIGSEATMETFDFKFSPHIPVAHIKTLASCEFLNKGENVIFLGLTGTGKTHFAKALCHQACRRYRSALFKSFYEFFKELKIMELEGKLDNYLKKLLKIDVLLIDDFAFRKIDATETELFYYIVNERYQTKSMIFTSNRALSDWAAIFPDPVTSNAIMDRLAHNAHQIVMKGESYRSKQKPQITNAKP